MNASKAIERAFAAAFRTYGELGEGVTIRCFQSLAVDGSWDEKKDRAFPVVAITCGVPRYNADQSTLYADCIILCGTKTDDDKDHAKWSQIYGAVQEVADRLFAQFRAGADGVELAAFKAAVLAECGENFNGVAGLEFADGMDPYDDNGVNMGGIVVRVHYSRNDY